MMKKPFVKRFRTKSGPYIYDVNSNELIRVNNPLYDIIEEIGVKDTKAIVDKWRHRYSEKEIRKSVKDIDDARQKHRLFSDHRPLISSGYTSTEHIKKNLEHNLNQIILEVTSRCNQRCKYCTFSGRYSYSRQHGEEDMPVDIALKAVEYFIENSKGKSEKIRPVISFYGGEPILNLNLIKKIVGYTKEKGVFDRFSFSLTINGTLLTDEAISFFADNDMMIMVSLDGPKEIHDRYRVFPSGKGTFDTTLANLKKIKRYYPVYFKDKVSINAVISPPYPFASVITFFSRRKLFEPIKESVIINPVNGCDTTFFHDFDLEDELKKLPVEFHKLRMKYKRALIRGQYDRLTIEKSLLLDDFFAISRRKMQPLEEAAPPFGACLPGQRRLLVNTKGKFFMCERVGANYEIGDVENGLNFKRIYDFITAYDEFFKECSNCWALRLCKKCFKDFHKGADFDHNRKRGLCKVMLEEIETNLIIFCEILEKKQDAFKVFENVVMV